MNLPQPRGPLGERVWAALREAPTDGSGDVIEVPLPPASASILGDDDFQLTLWVLYELHYRGFDDIPEHEWDPRIIAVRRVLESRFEEELCRCTDAYVADALAADGDLMDQVEMLVAAIGGPNLAGFIQREATADQVRDFLARRSLYHLKESDPHSFVLARIDGRAKTALSELQYDEYGAGQPDRLHARLYAEALGACGLDTRYGAYVEHTPATTLAVNNVMSLFALQRRLRGAALGHLAAFEATSSLPCRRIAAGIERVDFRMPRRRTSTSTSRPTPYTSRWRSVTCAVVWSRASPPCCPTSCSGWLAACTSTCSTASISSPTGRTGLLASSAGRRRERRRATGPRRLR